MSKGSTTLVIPELNHVQAKTWNGRDLCLFIPYRIRSRRLKSGLDCQASSCMRKRGTRGERLELGFTSLVFVASRAPAGVPFYSMEIIYF